ncbi:DUF2194 domain-containing protein [Paenibacillus sp. Soil724D2]|uniref:DUF2194 domain-containing protein n=1 Tax=Paenibacillus sp. (strain Soil724D2) TaxID=1736392 RepID=UPI000713C2CD|nr:DUF2194 domain-containing protein [Paenibacillus sp. Soil724D2]KRE39740.1 hypothetical protein ASG85_35210 [Paenibacillus sp. Soil724D2]
MSRKLIIFTCVIVSVLLLGVGLQTIRTVDLFPLSSARNIYQEAQFPVNSSAQSSVTGDKLSLYMYTNPKDSEGNKVKVNLQTALGLAKLQADSITADELRTIKPSPWTVILLTGEDISELDQTVIQSYLNEGGRLLAYTRFYAPEWNDMLGIESNNGFIERTIHGIEVNQTVFPGYPNLPASNALFSNSMLDIKLKPQINIYLSAEGTPMLWKNNYGQGSVVFWNSTSSIQKVGRGLMVQSIGLALDSLVTSQVAVRSLNIDDFPSPVPLVVNPLIRQEYGLSTPAFYERIWWADMARFAKLYGWKYTGLMIGNYQNQTSSPLPTLLGNYPKIMPYFGSKLLGLGGEIGLHGYNHQSLVTPEEPINSNLGYVPWSDKASMVESLQRMVELANTLFPGHELKTYVPPSNVLNKTGKAAIAEAVPSIDIIASLYYAGEEEGFLEQEFGVDSEFPQFTNFPRISSGYWLDDSTKFYVNDVIANFGLVNHFVHPDDALDIKRSSGKGWKFLSEQFEAWMASLNKSYAYLQPLTVRDAVNKLSIYSAGKVDVHYSKDVITITTKDELVPMHYTVRVPKNRTPEISKEAGVLTRMEHTDGLWHLEAHQPTVTLQLKEMKP